MIIVRIFGIDFEQLSNNSKSDLQYALNKSSNESDWENTFEEISKKVFERTPAYYYTRTNIAAEFRRRKFNCQNVDNTSEDAVKYHENGRISEIHFVEQ